MASKPTINKIWAEGTTNKYVLTEEAINTGISLKSDVVSNQLNSIANRTDEFIDNLQRVSAWNAGKTYEYGDKVCVLVNFKQLTTDKGDIYNLEVQCNNTAGTSNEPMLKNNASTFERNDDYSIPLYSIVANDSTKYIKDFINNDWTYCVSSDYLELKQLIDAEKQRALAAEEDLRKRIAILENTPAQSAISIHSIALSVQSGSTVSYPAGTLLEFTASKDLTSGGDCYIFYVVLNSNQTWNNLDVEMLQVGGTTSGANIQKYYLSDFVSTNHLQNFDYPVDLTLLRGFGTDATFFYGLGQYLSST